MKIIEPSVTELKQSSGFDGMLKQIEICGRTCYKSEDKIAEGSAEKFVNMLRSHAHGAMLEHGTIYLTIVKDNNTDYKIVDAIDEIILNKYTKYNCLGVLDKFGDTLSVREFNKLVRAGTIYYYITTNYRVIVENNWEDLLQFQTDATEYHFKRRTFQLTCNRGVSHEFVRHRVFSFAQESQRYVNYSKDKFGNEIKVINPIYFESESNLYDIWKNNCINAEKDYFNLISLGATPEKAREVLPNSCATTLIMTGFEDDWQHFFELRCAKDAHPQAQEIANMIKEVF